MKNKFTLIILLMVAMLLTACGAQATATPASVSAPTEAPYTKGVAATPAPVVVQDTATADNGYGNNNPPPLQSPAAANSAASGGSASISVGSGSFLIDANGMTLYLLTTDTNGTSTCDGGCADHWPPLTVAGQPLAGTGVNASMLSTTARADGSTQVTYNGHPLYFYKGDSAPGDENGQGAGGVWYAVSASGEAVK